MLAHVDDCTPDLPDLSKAIHSGKFGVLWPSLRRCHRDLSLFVPYCFRVMTNSHFCYKVKLDLPEP